MTAAIAADAMGPENVLGVMMPSRYSSQGSVDDSVELARNLGIQTMMLPICGHHARLTTACWPRRLPGCKPDVTEENIQSRIRGNLLMALSNKFGSLLLTTGNKSEMSVGYCTLYGDMNGGLAVIADLPKMMVYRVSHWRNRADLAIPEVDVSPRRPRRNCGPTRQIRTACRLTIFWTRFWNCTWSSARARKRLSRKGIDEETVRRVLTLVRIAEFKRKQAAPVLKVTSRAFGTGWRMPIVTTGIVK